MSKDGKHNSDFYQLSVVRKLVDNPANVSIISTGGKGLMDGLFVRFPLEGWFVKAADKNEELGPLFRI